MYSNFALSIIGIGCLVGEAVYHTYAHFLAALLDLVNIIIPLLCSNEYLNPDCTRRCLFICSLEKNGDVHLNKIKQVS